MQTIIVSGDKSDDISHGYLAFPYNKEQFQTFIISLLGKLQTISRPLFGQFEIYLSDLQDIHALLNQRIKQQNDGELIQFKSTLYFSDESSILLGSYEELITYIEIRPLTTKAIQLSWVYLIKFPDKEVKEKQEIVLMIKSGIHRYNRRFEGLLMLQGEEMFLNSSFNYDISYTARTWGFDIDKLLNDHLNSKFIKPNPFNFWVNKYSDQIGNFLGFVVFLSAITILIVIDSVSVVENSNSAYDIIKNNDINEKLNHIITKISNNAAGWVIPICSILFSGIFSVFVSFKATELFTLAPESYIILTREDKTTLPKRKKNEGINYVKIFLLFCSAIIIELIGAFIYSYISK